MIQLIHGDCLEEMKKIPDGSIDLVLTDPPYGNTNQNKWDIIIPFEPMWTELRRVTKQNSAIVLFSQLPFGAQLICSNLKDFRYEWVYTKPNAVGFLNANRMPLRAHENVMVFYRQLPTYNPQKTEGKPYRAKSGGRTSKNYGQFNGEQHTENVDGKRFPVDVFRFNKEQGFHPTQKPVALMEYLIKTYTNEGDTVLDFTMGSGTTGVACKNLNRNFIGIELDKDYFEIAKARIENV
jgi:site-specific DNA-methyltransferase (adenine-specific)